MRISFIIPVFNAEKYIEKCIESILSQELDHNEFEIITINDGSTDNSLSLLNDLAKKNPQLIIINDINRGAGASRNSGIFRAKGNIVTFVDADDYLEPNFIKEFVELFEKNNLDILGFETISIRGQKKIITKSLGKDYGIIFKGEDFLINYTDGFGPCAKLYNKKLFFSNNMFFPENIIPEDIELVPKLFLAADKIMFFDKPAYNYVYNSESVTKKKSKESYLKKIDGLMFVILSLNNFADRYENKNIAVYNYIHNEIINKCIKELYHFINHKVQLNIIKFRKINFTLKKSKLLPLYQLGKENKEFNIFNYYYLHIILYYTFILRLNYYMKKLFNKFASLFR